MNIGVIGPGNIGEVIIRKLRVAGYPEKMANARVSLAKTPSAVENCTFVPSRRKNQSLQSEARALAAVGFSRLRSKTAHRIRKDGGIPSCFWREHWLGLRSAVVAMMQSA